MGRLGIWHDNALALLHTIRELPNLKLEGIYTHFSSAESERKFTRIQRQRFLTILDQADITGLLIHADNSASLSTLSGDSPFNAVRIGLLQFGVRPYPDSLLEVLKLILSLVSILGLASSKTYLQAQTSATGVHAR